MHMPSREKKKSPKIISFGGHQKLGAYLLSFLYSILVGIGVEKDFLLKIQTAIKKVAYLLLQGVINFISTMGN